MTTELRPTPNQRNSLPVQLWQPQRSREANASQRGNNAAEEIDERPADQRTFPEAAATAWRRPMHQNAPRTQP